jgi:hypothetical protein
MKPRRRYTRAAQHRDQVVGARRRLHRTGRQGPRGTSGRLPAVPSTRAAVADEQEPLSSRLQSSRLAPADAEEQHPLCRPSRRYLVRGQRHDSEARLRRCRVLARNRTRRHVRYALGGNACLRRAPTARQPHERVAAERERPALVRNAAAGDCSRRFSVRVVADANRPARAAVHRNDFRLSQNELRGCRGQQVLDPVAAGGSRARRPGRGGRIFRHRPGPDRHGGSERLGSSCRQRQPRRGAVRDLGRGGRVYRQACQRCNILQSRLER